MKTLVAAILGIAVALLTSCDDTVRLAYATKVAADAEPQFARGWLPEIIPASSTEITMLNDLNLNISNGEFSFDPADHAEFVAQLARASAIDKNGAAAYTFEDWTFWIDPEKNHCEFRMILSRTNNKANKAEMATPRKPSD